VSGVTQGLGADQSALLAMLTTDAHFLNPPHTPGHIHWLFDSSGEAFDYLAAGEVLELTYTVEVTDSKGSKASQIVTIQVMGSNDAPKILVAPGNKDGIALDETNSRLSATGSIAVTDADLTQGVLGTIKSVSILGDSAGWNGDTQKIMAMLQVNQLVVSAGNSVGLLSWSFDSGNESFDFLPKGAVLYLNYTVEITDSLTSFDQQISIQIVGTNDSPVLKPGASSVLTGAPETGIQLYALVGISDAVKDVDHGSGWGLVLTSSGELSGGWQYRLNGANEWFAIETTTVDRGTLLRSNDFIRFISNSGGPTSGSLGIRAWDLSFGAAGSSVNLSDLEQQSAISSSSGELLANIASAPATIVNNPDSGSNSANTKTDTKSVTQNDSSSGTQSETKSGSEVTVSNSETASDNLGIGGNQSSTVPDQIAFGASGDPKPILQQLTEELRVSETKLNLDLIDVATAPSKSDNYYRLITNAKEKSLELGEAYVFAKAKPTYLDNELIWTRFFEGLNESSRELLINQDELGVPHFVASTASLLTFGYLAWVVRGGVLLTTFMSSLPTWKALDILPLIENSGQDKETIEQIVDSKVTA
jgi:VCBS repeat-containing protein